MKKSIVNNIILPVEDGKYNNRNAQQFIDEISKHINILIDGDFPDAINEYVSDKLSENVPLFLENVEDGWKKARLGEKTQAIIEKEEKLEKEIKKLEEAKKRKENVDKDIEKLVKESIIKNKEAKRLTEEKENYEKTLKVNR